jgi:hypothetical protein
MPAHEANPYHFGSAAGTPYFTDRERELRAVKSVMLNGQNAILISPRRYGKSSLLIRAVSEVRAEGGRTGRCNLMRCSSDREVADEILKAVVEGPMGWLRSHMTEVSLKLRQLRVVPDMYLDEAGRVHLRPFPTTAAANWKDVIGDAVRLLNDLRDEEHPVSLVIDEFQKAAELNPAIPDLFKALTDDVPRVSLVLAGSKRHLLEAMTNHPDSSPLYNVGIKVYLSKIERDVFVAYLMERAEDSGKSLPPAVAGRIYDITSGVPNDVQQLAYFSWEAAKRVIDDAAVDSALPLAVGDHQGEFVATFEALSLTQQRLLKLVARGDQIDNWGAKAVQRELDVTQNAARAAGAALEKQDLVMRRDERWVIASGLMREWLTGTYD